MTETETTTHSFTEPILSPSTAQVIAKNDPEYIETTSDAFIATSFATELFIKELCTEVAKTVPLGQNEITYDSLAEFVAVREPFQFLREMVPQTKRLSDLVRENRVRYTVMNSAVSSNGAGDDVRTEAKTDTDTRLDAVVNEVEVNEDANMTKPLPPPQQQPPSSQPELKGISTNGLEVGTETETGNKEHVAATSRNDIKEIVEINIYNNTDDEEEEDEEEEEAKDSC